MNHFFLPIVSGSLETGSFIFTKDMSANTLYFANQKIEEEPLGLTDNVLVQNSFIGDLNGVFTYTTIFNGKPYYVKGGNTNLYIRWFNNKWEIYNLSVSFAPIYFSNQNVNYPWNVTVWQVLPGFGSAPLVTK